MDIAHDKDRSDMIGLPMALWRHRGSGGAIMAVIAQHAMGLFGTVWAMMCLLAGVLVTDELLRTQGAAPAGGGTGSD